MSMTRSIATLFLMVWRFILYLYRSKNKTERCDIFSIVADSASWGWKWRGENNSNKSTML